MIPLHLFAFSSENGYIYIGFIMEVENLEIVTIVLIVLLIVFAGVGLIWLLRNKQETVTTSDYALCPIVDEDGQCTLTITDEVAKESTYFINQQYLKELTAEHPLLEITLSPRPFCKKKRVTDICYNGDSLISH